MAHQRYILEPRYSSPARHPVWISILVGLTVGQLLTLLSVLLGHADRLQGFSALIPGWEVVFYNVVGSISCIGILIGMFRQGKNRTISETITGLLIEKYSTGVLFLVILVYTIHNAAKDVKAFPVFLVFLGLGLIGKWFEIRRELHAIKTDLLAAELVSERALLERSSPR